MMIKFVASSGVSSSATIEPSHRISRSSVLALTVPRDG